MESLNGLIRLEEALEKWVMSTVVAHLGDTVLPDLTTARPLRIRQIDKDIGP
jgi:hypothetical protein